MSEKSDNFQVATLIESKMVAEDVKSLTFSLDNWPKHKAGQHCNIRLTSEDGYQAERDYSIASAPEQQGVVEFGIQLLKNGEVSPYLFEMGKGEQLEIKGPIGGHFIWDSQMEGPLILIGGGSGMVPLMSILRHHINNYKNRDVVFLISARNKEHVLYQDELEEIAKKYPDIKIVYTFTEKAPDGWKGYMRRIDIEMLRQVLSDLVDKMPNIYICGPTPFVESVATNLVGLKINPHLIKTERFG